MLECTSVVNMCERWMYITKSENLLCAALPSLHGLHTAEVGRDG